jgi:hypothetical protein
MEVLLERCAGLDVHQASVVCCVLIGVVIAHVSRGSPALRSAARIAVPVKLPAIGLAAVPHHICRMVMFGSQ